MTVWTPGRVAGFAYDAGWRGGDLAVAVAVALAATGGADHAESAGATPPRAVRRGLWLIPVGLWVGDPDGALFNPAVNAQVAYGLTVASDAGWGWSVAWRAGGWRTLLDVATVAAGRPMWTQPATGPLDVGPLVDGARRVQRTLQQMMTKG